MYQTQSTNTKVILILHAILLFYTTTCRGSIVVRVLGWDMKVPGAIPADVNCTGYASDTSKSLGECLRLRSNHNLYLNGRLARSKTHKHDILLLYTTTRCCRRRRLQKVVEGTQPYPTPGATSRIISSSVCCIIVCVIVLYVCIYIYIYIYIYMYAHLHKCTRQLANISWIVISTLTSNNTTQ